MDTHQQTHQLAAGSTHVPAYLWIGDHQQLVNSTKKWLQARLCTTACGACITCRQINEQQHHSILWLEPEKNYTLEDIEVIHATIIFQLPPEQEFYFIIQKADLLSVQCSNSLLKSIEEPPRGYHFILLAQHLDAILPTIRSRCQIEMHAGAIARSTFTTLFSFFTTTHNTNQAAFLKELEQSKITERESAQLLDMIFHHWHTHAKQALLDGDQGAYQRAQTVVSIIQQMFTRLPMPGSSKLFWKNFFLQMKNG